ncbi:uncharacterized protein EMH_0095010 [Eimeria mitis]|uniref:Uncharacterized protein n=1 Tax=Eimeria mitis TaxID=44415 RepID=U6KGE9_9EIME|nr:uncharacterized protein EMH_0095010 [Eimeria mitis]CDJ35831.1 hypothetical protein, conserved [Eimeria mitis]
MEGRRGALELSEEIELCGKLRNDIGKALKTDAHNAAKAQSESEESKALETLIENEALNLEESIAAAETSFLTSVEALLRSIMNGEEQTRGLLAELQALRSALDVLGRTKGELVPVLESCQEAFDSAKREYEQSKKNNAHHLESIERCREEEEQMKTERERALSLLKEEMQKATEEMYSTIERMKELRKQYVSSAHAHASAKFDCLRLCLYLLEEMTRMERTEMAALRENEGTILSESLEVLQKAEKEADEATGAGEELKGLIEAVEAILTEQKKITHTLVLSRSRVDLQLKNVFLMFCLALPFVVFRSFHIIDLN